MHGLSHLDEAGLRGSGNGGVSPPSLGGAGGVTIVGEYDHHGDLDDGDEDAYRMVGSRRSRGHDDEDIDLEEEIDEEEEELEEDIDIDVDGDGEEESGVRGQYSEAGSSPPLRTSKKPRIDDNDRHSDEPEDLTFDAGKMRNRDDSQHKTAKRPYFDEIEHGQRPIRPKADLNGGNGLNDSVSSVTGGNNNHSSQFGSSKMGGGGKLNHDGAHKATNALADQAKIDGSNGGGAGNEVLNNTTATATTTMECCDGDFETAEMTDEEEEYEEEDAAYSGSSPSPSSMLDGVATSSSSTTTGAATAGNGGKHHSRPRQNSDGGGGSGGGVAASAATSKDLVGERLFASHHQLFAATASTGGSIQLGLAGLSSRLAAAAAPPGHHHHHQSFANRAAAGVVGAAGDPSPAGIVLRAQKEISQQ